MPSSMWAARSPSRRGRKAITASGGSTKPRAASASFVTSEMSSGTRRPWCCTARSTPSAMSCDPATIAVGGSSSASSRSVASSPCRAVNVPGSTVSSSPSSSAASATPAAFSRPGRRCEGPADEADVAMPELGKVRHRGARARAVVAEHRGALEIGRRIAIDQHERHAELADARERRLVVVGRQQQQQPVDAALLEQADAVDVQARIVARAREQHRVALVREHVLGARRDLAEPVAPDVACDEPDGVRRAAAQSLGQHVALVAELAGRLEHAIARLGIDVGVPGERA